jgi:hypothetical protein
MALGWRRRRRRRRAKTARSIRSIAATPATTPATIYLTGVLDDAGVGVGVGPMVFWGNGGSVCRVALLYLDGDAERVESVDGVGEAIGLGQMVLRVHDTIEQDNRIVDASGDVNAEGVGTVRYGRVGIDELIVCV